MKINISPLTKQPSKEKQQENPFQKLIFHTSLVSGRFHILKGQVGRPHKSPLYMQIKNKKKIWESDTIYTESELGYKRDFFTLIKRNYGYLEE